MAKQYGRRSGKTAEQVALMDAHLAISTPGETFLVTLPHGTLTATRLLNGCGVVLDDDEGMIEVEAANLKEALILIFKKRDAIHIVVEKGRAYSTKGGGLSVKVWSKDVGEVKTLKDVFGGNYYRHGSGLYWMCGNRRQLKTLATEVWSSLEEGHQLGLLEEVFNDEVLYQPEQ